MVEDRFYSSLGVLRYSVLETGMAKLVVEVERDIAFFAHALVPQYVRLNGQRWAPHITVIRHEDAVNHRSWGRHEGQTVAFEYGSFAYNNDWFYWLRVRSDDLVCLRLELGLPIHSRYSRPPDGTRWFHITIGNTRP